jgi:hypothetical protein
MRVIMVPPWRAPALSEIHYLVKRSDPNLPHPPADVLPALLGRRSVADSLEALAVDGGRPLLRKDEPVPTGSP